MYYLLFFQKCVKREKIWHVCSERATPRFHDWVSLCLCCACQLLGHYNDVAVTLLVYHYCHIVGTVAQT